MVILARFFSTRVSVFHLAACLVLLTRIRIQITEIGQAPPAVGNPLRVVTIKMDPARVDEHLEFYKSQVVPELKATPGFRAVRNMVDRATGEGAVGTIWADEASMRATEASTMERQKRAAERGIEITGPTYRVVLLSHLV